MNGVKADTASKGAESFEESGDFSPKEVGIALNQVGFRGKVLRKGFSLERGLQFHRGALGPHEA